MINIKKLRKTTIPLWYVFFFLIYNTSFAKKLVPEKNLTTEACCFDLIIIGGGSAAFSGANTACKLGKTVLLINSGLRIGGTCLNVGCMPSKYLVRAAKSIYKSKKNGYIGIQANHAFLDFHKFMKYKKAYINKLWQEKYPPLLNKLKNLTYIKGWAKLKTNSIVEVNGRQYTAKKILIATGASTDIPKINGINNIKYLTHRSLFDIVHKPNTITIIGAGYIGLEVACMFSQFGTKVTILNKNDRILHNESRDVGNELEKYLRALGIKVHHNFIIKKFEKRGNSVIIHGKGQGDQLMNFTETNNHIVLATGIRANTNHLGLETLGIKMDKKGRIFVNNKQQTNVGNIFAAGDCVKSPQYVYTAIEEGRVAANNAFVRRKETVNYYALPWVMFTNPEFAGVGLDEEHARIRGIPYDVSIISIKDLAIATTSLEDRGFIKLIRNTKTNRIIGGRIIGENASELIMQISLVMKYGIKVSSLKKVFYPFLTLSEGIKLAAQKFN